ncbi:MAG: GNAT family N-acetyltransferase [Armatimonadetes bacterium]|nr:GNAT family N-acetyltransferase [Armatimonadota bacterium]NOG91711.1 GNAT family N-acetyltransferase [Armatimonadota bacterium]
MQNVRIRPWVPSDDVQELTRLLHRAYRRLLEMGLHFTATSQPQEVTIDRISQGETYVAECDGKIVGTITLVGPGGVNRRAPALYSDPDVCYFTQFAVEPDLQRAGIGRALLSHVEARACELGAKSIALDTSELAHHLIQLYERWGYQIVATHSWGAPVNYRSVVMAKSIERGAL